MSLIKEDNDLFKTTRRTMKVSSFLANHPQTVERSNEHNYLFLEYIINMGIHIPQVTVLKTDKDESIYGSASTFLNTAKYVLDNKEKFKITEEESLNLENIELDILFIETTNEKIASNVFFFVKLFNYLERN
jgi:hypothetical protein